jgi:RND family efflux transporter MFP subunit
VSSMNNQTKTDKRLNFRSLGTILVILLAVVVLAAAARTIVGEGGGDKTFVFYQVKRTDLPIVVTERGSLESQMETTVRCEVENVSVDRGGNYGTQIIFIVPNGTAVAKGELIVELDSSVIRDRLDTQTLNYQKAISSKTQATAKYKNQLLQNQTTAAEAELDVLLAALELEMYMDKEDGTFQLSVEEIEREIDNTKNLTLEARASLELARVDRTGMKELFKLGYRGKSDLDQSQFEFLKAEDRLASYMNQMRTSQGNRRKLTKYEFQMQKLRLEGAVETADRALEQVINDNQSLEAQALAAKEEAENTEQKELERLERLTLQLGRCKILAPHGGMVVYQRDRRGNTDIVEGATVRERQSLLTLPDLSLMQVKTQVHEAVLDQVRPDMPATVRVDAFPDITFNAIVSDVAVVPSSSGGWFSSGGVKTYETVVKILDEVDRLKPGMTAVVTIHVDQIPNVLAVPVQSVVQVNREIWCYVEAEKEVERRDVELGRSNEKFVHIREGLSAGDRVVLNPMDIFDEQQQQTPNEISPEAGTPEMPESLQAAAKAAAQKPVPPQGGPGSEKTQGAPPQGAPSQEVKGKQATPGQGPGRRGPPNSNRQDRPRGQRRGEGQRSQGAAS